MADRIPRQTLFLLRNHIPIDFVIADFLNLPSKMSEGFLRFLCPFCHEFNSATNPKTNLARCFRCNKNFNPIDLVMADKKLPFKKAVALLLPLLNPPQKNPTSPMPPSQSRPIYPRE
jgi:DNA primase